MNAVNGQNKRIVITSFLIVAALLGSAYATNILMKKAFPLSTESNVGNSGSHMPDTAMPNPALAEEKEKAGNAALNENKPDQAASDFKSAEDLYRKSGNVKEAEQVKAMRLTAESLARIKDEREKEPKPDPAQITIANEPVKQ